MRGKAPVINGVFSLLEHRIPAKFPKLRFGFIEAGASWVPLVDYSLRRNLQAFGQSSAGGTRERFDVQDSLFQTNRIYVTCQVDEDLPMILRYIGEDNLLVGSDYTHQDSSQELHFLDRLQERADREDIPDSAVRKIAYDNPKAFYGL